MQEHDLNIPMGYTFAAAAAGIKKRDRLDTALIVSETAARCAAVYTRNRVVAAPLMVTREHLAQGICQAVLVNSGNANACTGAAGLQVARDCATAVADALGIDPHLVAVASTGVIGQLLPGTKIMDQLPSMQAQQDPASWPRVAEAIMTTDSYPKISHGAAEAGGRPYRLLGLAKGAGMIHPDMATMLGFVLTDAKVCPRFLDQALRQAVAGSFNSITVDRDTSTNDMVLLLANGAADTPEITAGSPDAEMFQKQLDALLLDLAKMIVRDGEGATKLVHIRVEGAQDAMDARKVAYAVATSSLVKTAFFGEDANWGRIIAAAGYSGADVDPDKVQILFDDICLCEGGLYTGSSAEAQATEVLRKAEYQVTINLHLGDGCSDYYTSDLTFDYVKINADYRT